MVPVALLAILLVACPLGKLLGKPLHRSPGDPGWDQASPNIVLSSSRCKRETLQSVRKVILDSLSLQAEPHVSVPGMTCLRDQWKAVFEGPGRAIPLQPNIPGSMRSSEPLSPGNSTAPMCCKLTSQIFIRDLGWDQWIIYPESFTYTRCSPCDPRMDPSVFHCAEDSLTNHKPLAQNLFSACMLMSSFLQMPCCESTYYELLPFLYLDATSALVITSVPMTRECGCRPVTLGP
ncbi:inhibin beta E chain-like [Electrophorus electricus]|uniref:inhibin beta E chain-like n=1 Tax=Electrophorus electricus TaxID=8005 RepID=UPI0015D002A5|nr:inhibin beta E chain-like [Electrophorus electricus]